MYISYTEHGKNGNCVCTHRSMITCVCVCVWTDHNWFVMLLLSGKLQLHVFTHRFLSYHSSMLARSLNSFAVDSSAYAQMLVRSVVWHPACTAQATAYSSSRMCVINICQCAKPKSKRIAGRSAMKTKRNLSSFFQVYIILCFYVIIFKRSNNRPVRNRNFCSQCDSARARERVCLRCMWTDWRTDSQAHHVHLNCMYTHRINARHKVRWRECEREREKKKTKNGNAATHFLLIIKYHVHLDRDRTAVADLQENLNRILYAPQFRV